MKVKIISVTFDTTLQKKDGGTYQGTQIVFTNLEKGTVESKNISSAFINKNTQLKDKLKTFNNGDVVDFIFEKQGAFNNLVDASKSTTEEVTAPIAPTKRANAPFGQKEDPQRQRAIIRQNSITNATTLFARTITSDTRVSLDMAKEIVEIARIFEAYSAGDE
jgi:paraquat-inducible protein B